MQRRTFFSLFGLLPCAFAPALQARANSQAQPVPARDSNSRLCSIRTGDKPFGAMTKTIQVIGVGGGGNNVIDSLFRSGGQDCFQLIAVDTDARTLENTQAAIRIQLGTPNFLSAGGSMLTARMASALVREEILAQIKTASQIILVAGLGGGTGGGAAPYLASLAKEIGIPVKAVVGLPFDFEGEKRANQAHSALEKLKISVDTLLALNPQVIEKELGETALIDRYFEIANQALIDGIRELAEPSWAT